VAVIMSAASSERWRSRCRPGSRLAHIAAIPALLGQLPARLDLQVSEQSSDEASSRPARLDPAEPARERANHQVNGSSPLGRLYAVALGHRKV
jgi:hypothetical protein